jgi:FlaA1/EpsC-like NDP-sugar epimerase
MIKRLKEMFQSLIKPTYFKRTLFFMVSDSIIAIISLYSSFLLRFEFNLSQDYMSLFLNILPVFIILKIITFWIFKVYKITWRYVSLYDFYKILNAVFLFFSIVIISVLLLRHYPNIKNAFPNELSQTISTLPLSIIFIDALIFLILTSALRISKRFYYEIIKNQKTKRGLKTLIIGAGNAGEMILRDLRKSNFSQFYPVGFLDDDENKAGTYIHNVKVLDKIDNIENIIKEYEIEAIIIAIPSINYKRLQEIYLKAKKAGIGVIKIVPEMYKFEKPEINVKKLEDIKIEDLLARQIVKVDNERIKSFISGKRVLITGAGGSIGKEISIQVAQFEPSELIFLDVDETELFYLESKIKEIFSFKDKIHFIVADVRDYQKIYDLFEKFKPDIVFHAAAYKHVPMMEYNPEEAIKVNILGTYNLVLVSKLFNVEKFINISTDKAVKPKSVMGATKRMAEYICKAFNDISNTEFISVRFGNVLGSRGSVLPVWLEQIKNGGPITVTHPEMKRYFMTIPEAVSLVLMASSIGKGGKVLVLDMGEPIRILDLAEALIRIHGLEPYKDIDIVFTGIRPGENLFEDLLTAKEGTDSTNFERIYVSKISKGLTIEEILKIIELFRSIVYEAKSLEKRPEIKRLLSEILEFKIEEY